jgi:DNA-binding transcriptional ArsR family regulator
MMTPDELTARKLAALAHPARLAIIRMLVRSGPAGLSAGKLGEPLNIAANALTFHLQKLAHVGLVTSQRQGQFIVYSTVFSNLLDLMDSLVGACCADTSEKCDPMCPTTEPASANVGYSGISAAQINQPKRSLK